MILMHLYKGLKLYKGNVNYHNYLFTYLVAGKVGEFIATSPSQVRKAVIFTNKHLYSQQTIA